MSQFNYTSYRADILRLSRSIVIKFDAIAEAINEHLLINNVPVNELDPRTWKYYLNLSGQYHPTDELMVVRSMDTLEDIAFTRENLKYHRATAREYRYGTVYYNNLKAKYPTQTDLINGIISPVDIDQAINSNNGDILYYDASLVEGNEDNLIHELQEWIRAYHLRWFNEQYLLTDDLYLPYYLGALYRDMPMAIELIRLRNCHTRRAHSFHIREHLASNGRLDRYLPYLNKTQQLWLYRNIRFLMRNAGKQEIFDRLVDNLLTPRGIPLIGYDLSQNSEAMPDELYPQVELIKHDINLHNVAPGQEKATVGEVLEREQHLARDNAVVQWDTQEKIIETAKMAGFSNLPTKVLDSEVVDRSNSSVRSLLHVLMNHWVYLASSGRYRAYVSIPNPRTGQYMTMTVKDALITAYYCVGQLYEYPFSTIPVLYAYDVLRTPLPTHAELQSIVPDGALHDGLIQAIMDRVPPMGEYISTERFYDDCATLHAQYLKLWELYSFQDHHRNRAYAEQVVRRHFMNIRCPLHDGPISYEQWFTENQYQVADLNRIELEQLLMDCVNIATGSNLNPVITLGEIQRELLSMIARLSSYPLQFLHNVAFTDFTVLGLVSTRFGDMQSEKEDFIRFYDADITIRKVWAELTTKFSLPIEAIDPAISYSVETKACYKIDPTVDIRFVNQTLGHYRAPVPGIGIRGYSFTFDQDPIEGPEMDQYVG